MYTILSLSDSDKHFESAIAEYHKRLGKDLTFVKLKPSKVQNREQAIQADTDQLMKWLEKHHDNYDQSILLSLNGESKTTEDRVRLFPRGKKYCFIIGGPHGLDEDRLLRSSQGLRTKTKALGTLGLGKQTMVHGLAKLVVTEQIYRIWMIQHGKSYHY